MDVLFALLCGVALVLSMGVGVGVTFYAEKFWGRRAYLVGWLVPIFLFATLYALYHLWLRLLSCTPTERVCGEPFQTLALIFVAVLCVVMLANASAQFSLYLFRHRRALQPPVSEQQEGENMERAKVSETAEPTPEAESPTASDETSLEQET